MTGLDQPAHDAGAPTFPLIVGVTGHRDITPEARDAIADTVCGLLRHLKQRFGADAVYVLSALAQGADQLVANAAVANGLQLIAALPMPLDDYRATMANDPGALCEFEHLRRSAALELVLPWVTPPDRPTSDKLQYEQLGAVLSRYSHILVALWDGTQRWEALNPTERQGSRGGTAHVVYLRAHAEREAEGFRHSRLFADADSRLDMARGGPTLQIVTPRLRAGGETAHFARRKTAAGDCIMLRVGAAEGRLVSREELAGESPQGTDDLKALFGENGALELHRIEQLNACIRRFGRRDRDTHRDQVGYLCPRHATDLTDDAGNLLAILRRLQASADTAAQVYQRRLLGVWSPAGSLAEMLANLWRNAWKDGLRNPRWPPVGALLVFVALGPMAVGLFSGYAHLLHRWWLLALYPVSVGVGLAYYRLSRRGEWQNRFQDYRALAEAMRVQIFWALSGAPRAVSDHYLRMQKDELGWVQFALRGPALWAAALALRLDEPARDLINECWIEDQRNYFVGKTERHGKALQDLRANEEIEKSSREWIVLGLILTVVLIGAALAPTMIDGQDAIEQAERSGGKAAVEWLRDAMLFLVPTALTIGAAFAFYGHTRAYEAHAHSYATMGRLFAHVRREADTSECRNGADEYKRLVFDLGREALAESADWLKDHRSRPITQEVH